MDFPRFNQGAAGNLTFAHLNEVFALLEQLRPLLVRVAEGDTFGDALIIARITGANADGLMSWEEVVPATAAAAGAKIAWKTRAGGRKSGALTSETFDPAVVPPVFAGESVQATATPLETGTVTVLRKGKREGGKSLWVAMAGGASGPAQIDAFPAMIVGAVARPPYPDPNSGIVYQWLYDWDEADISNSSNYQWFSLPNGRKGRNQAGAGQYPPAFNGAEVNGLTGAGGGGPSGVVARNARVMNGVVVTMFKVPGSSLYYFSCPNTLTVSCGA